MSYETGLKTISVVIICPYVTSRWLYRGKITRRNNVQIESANAWIKSLKCFVYLHSKQEEQSNNVTKVHIGSSNNNDNDMIIITLVVEIVLVVGAAAEVAIIIMMIIQN